jgi:FkbM family methyltransferase
MKAAFYAQNGEDRALLEFFGGAPGFYVDVGANDGLSNSNTAALDEMGWRGLLVEADPILAVTCRRARPRATVVACAAADPTRRGSHSPFLRISPGHDKTTGLSTLVDSPELKRKAMQIGASISTITVPVRSLDDILEKHNAPEAFELLSVDVEGAELEVFLSCNLSRWRPRIIIAENNSAGGDTPVRRYLRRFDYHLACRTGVNDWYVKLLDLPRFAGRRLGLALIQCRSAIERQSATLERFFIGQPSGFFVQLGFEIGMDPGRSGILERDGWQGLLIEMDEEKEGLARRTRNRLQAVRCAIGPEVSTSGSRRWLVPEVDWMGFSPHTRAIAKGTVAPTGAVPSELPTRQLGCVLREYCVPPDFELLAIGPGFDAADAVIGMDWQHFRPRVVLVDSRAAGQERVRRFLESVGWRRVHWRSMCFWFVRRVEVAGFRRERILLAMKSLLWALKRYCPRKPPR